MDASLTDAQAYYAEMQLERDSFWERCRAPKSLVLKEGAQVMLIYNADLESSEKLVNGSRGIVTGFKKMEDHMNLREQRGGGANTAILDQFPADFQLPVVRFQNGREEVIEPVEFAAEFHRVGTCLRIQIPLILAWAMSIHKSQGMSIDCLVVDIGGAFADGQVYVALSRARSIDGLEIRGYSEGCVKANSCVNDFMSGKPVCRWKEEAEAAWPQILAKALATQDLADEAPPCQCGNKSASVVRTVRKAGPNQGRQFYCCPKAQGKGCGFFKWTEGQVK